MTKIYTYAASVAMVLCVAGCHALPSATPKVSGKSVGGMAIQQLMIRLKGADAPCTVADITRLATETFQQLQYIRAMSGDACVVSHSAVDSDALARGFDRLKSHPSIEAVEVDRIVTIKN